MHLLIINGPNLNLLGQREPGVYGTETFESYLERLKALFPDDTIDYYQSNVEGELINYLHGCMGKVQGIILNAGAYTHTSIAIADAIAAINIPVVICPERIAGNKNSTVISIVGAIPASS